MAVSVSASGTTINTGLSVDTSGSGSTMNITAATVVKAGPGRLVRLNVIAAGAAAGAIYDAASTSGNTAANQTFAIPNAIGTYYLDWPHLTGIVITPGSGQTISVSYV